MASEITIIIHRVSQKNRNSTLQIPAPSDIIL